MKPLPGRPSLESLRKQAKKLARDVSARDADAIARARSHLPNADLPLTQRDAQLVIAREYGYAGWQDLSAEVSKRLGNTLEWAVARARRVIHDNDVERLKQLLAEYPALLSWAGDGDAGGLLGMATDAYGDCFNPNRERSFTRAACAEVLIDAGAVVMPVVAEGILRSRARGLLALFHRKDLLPRNPRFFAALGDIDAIRRALDESGHDAGAVNDVFVIACNFEHEAIASLLLERSIKLDSGLGKLIDQNVGRAGFIKYFIEKRPAHWRRLGPWRSFAFERIKRALVDRDMTAFVGGLQRESWLLDERLVSLQNEIIESAALNGRGEFLVALFDRDPAILRGQAPPPSQAIEFAVTYAHTDVIPLLTRIWPLPDDLPYAAAMGNLSRVKHWFDESGAPALGDLQNHYPCNDAHAREQLHWNPCGPRHVLDAALAFAVINHHFDVADFLLEHGADINTNWNSHEPASILHHLVFENNDESMRFLIDRGIDMTIRDYRWDATAYGWALHGNNDPELARWLMEAELHRHR